MSDVRQAIDQKQPAQLRRAAHTIKGSVDCFGARPTVAAAQRLENMGRDAQFEGAEEAWIALEREVERLIPALADWNEVAENN